MPDSGTIIEGEVDPSNQSFSNTSLFLCQMAGEFNTLAALVGPDQYEQYMRAGFEAYKDGKTTAQVEFALVPKDYRDADDSNFYTLKRTDNYLPFSSLPPKSRKPLLWANVIETSWGGLTRSLMEAAYCTSNWGIQTAKMDYVPSVLGQPDMDGFMAAFVSAMNHAVASYADTRQLTTLNNCRAQLKQTKSWPSLQKALKTRSKVLGPKGYEWD